MAGPVKHERILAKRVREISLNLITRYLEDTSPENDRFRKDLLLKLATNVLPRINEISGPDGGEIPLPILNGLSNTVPIDNVIPTNNGNEENIRPQETN